MLGERASGDQLHHEEQLSLVDPGIEDRDGVLMDEPGSRSCLALEPSTQRGVGAGRRRFVQQLDRHGPVEDDIVRLVDVRRPAGPDSITDAVTAGEHQFHLSSSRLNRRGGP